MFAIFFSQHRSFFIVVSLIVLAVVAGAIAWQQYFRSPSDTSGAPPPPVATGTPPLTLPSPQASTFDKSSADKSGGTAPPVVPTYKGAAVQTLNPDPNILKQVSADTYERSQKELAEFAVSLAANPRDASGWMRVAFIKRFYGDYAGTADAYEYLNLIAPSDGLPFFNLAGLYGYYLKQPAKAIPKYEAALQRDPMNPTYYGGFADFYREVMKDLPAAERVLEQGLAKISSDVNLMVSYAALSGMMGKTARAIEYYDKVLARTDLDAPQRAAITAEVERLKAKNP